MKRQFILNFYSQFVSNLKLTPICVDVLLMFAFSFCFLVWPVQFSMEIGKLFKVAKPIR